MTEPPSQGCVVRLGVDPTGGIDPALTLWNEAVSIGQIEIANVSPRFTNLAITIYFANNGLMPASASVERVDLVPTTFSSDIPEFPMAPVANIVQADAKVEQGNEDLHLFRLEEAMKAFEDTLTYFPDSRLEASKALVGMAEIGHANQMEAMLHPTEKHGDLMGVPDLRRLRERYPDQTDEVALATCKLGEFYLGKQLLPMARSILESVVQDFPGTPAERWAQVNLINAQLWSGNTDAARDIYKTINQAHSKGRATEVQLGWADYFMLQQEDFGKRAAKREELFNQYRDSFPSLAVRIKHENAMEAWQRHEYYRAIEDLRTILSTIKVPLPELAPVRLHLADILNQQGWKPEHFKEAEELLIAVVDSQVSAEHHRDAALHRQDENRQQQVNSRIENQGGNLLSSGSLAMDQKSALPGWRCKQNLMDSPNWFLCDWVDGAPDPEMASRAVAWNSANIGLPRTMQSVLSHDSVEVRGNVPTRVTAWVAGDGWDGGTIEDVKFQLMVSYFDGFRKPLEESSTESHTPSASRLWSQIVLESVTPADARSAEITIRFHTEGSGHHAAAVAKVEFVEEEVR